MSKTSVFYKMQVLVIVFLFIGISVVTSTGNIMDNISSNTKNLNTEDSSKNLRYRGNYGYAYNAYPGPEETFYFPLDDPSEYNYCGETINGDILYGGTIDCNGIWYASQYGNGLLYGIDTNNGCDMWLIGGGGSGKTELAWDDETALLYIIDGYNLYWYDPETGEGDYLGNIDVSITQIEFDNNDILYGFELFNTDDVYTIDLSTLETTLVGTLTNITSTYGLRVAFDKDTNNLYLLGDYLYICDTETYECTPIGGNISLGIISYSFVIPYGSDDTTPPETTCTISPSEPDGENGWYLSNVTIELNATDDLSGVKEIRISICDDPEIIIPGNYVEFFFEEDCKDYYIDYWAIDNAGNVEPKNRFEVNIDRTKPEIDLSFLFDYKKLLAIYIFTAKATDSMSGMDRVEFYTDDEHKWTVIGNGPEYEWIWKPRIYGRVKGFILFPDITEEYVKFFAILVRADLGPGFPKIHAFGYDKAGNMESDSLIQMDPPYDIYDILLFQEMILSSNFSGYIGRLFIDATFDTG